MTSKHQSALVEKGNKKGFMIIERAKAHVFQAYKRDRGAEKIYYRFITLKGNGI
jgi:ribosomal protein RSM22 (predicted rRNA methylase)